MPDDLRPVTTLDIYKVALETRNFEIGLFWQRSNYFLVLNTAVAAGYFASAKPQQRLLLAATGVVVALLWFRVNLGGKFWQSRWEEALSEMEKQLHPDINLFSASWESIEYYVRRSLDRGRHGRVRKLFDRLTLRKPSVSFAMTLVSLVFFFFWCAGLVLALRESAV